MKKILTEQRLCELAGVRTEEARASDTEEMGATTSVTDRPLPPVPLPTTPAQEAERMHLVRAQLKLKRFFFADPVAQDREYSADTVAGAKKALGAKLETALTRAQEESETYLNMKKINSSPGSALTPKLIKQALLLNPNWTDEGGYKQGHGRPDWEKLRSEFKESNPQLWDAMVTINNKIDFNFLDLNKLASDTNMPPSTLAGIYSNPWNEELQQEFDNDVRSARAELQSRDPLSPAGTNEEDLHLIRVNRVAKALSARASDESDAGWNFVNFFNELVNDENKDIITNPAKLKSALDNFDATVKEKQKQIAASGALPVGNRPSRLSSK